MRLRELFEDGRIVKGVNTTVDVGPDEIKTQAAKFGNTVDRDGRPPTLSKKVKGKSTNVLFNLDLTENVRKASDVETVIVSPGHTVYSIARAFSTTPQIIQKINNLDKNFTIRPGQEIKVPKLGTIEIPSEKEKKTQDKKNNNKNLQVNKNNIKGSVTGRPLEVYFRKFLESQGIKGEELTAIMAQSDVETDHFKTLKEYGGKNYFKMYEPVYRKDKKTGKLIIDPKTKKPKHFNEKADDLGNDYRGDGARYKGRGFLQITGRYNYRVIGQDIGVDLENNPEILEKDKEIAAKASLAYWKRFSKPKIKNFKDVKGVTSTINPGLKHLDKRKDRHKEYKVAMQ